MNRKSYEYSYRFAGKDYLGSSMHESDEEAISYYRSLAENGQIEMYSLRCGGLQLWERRFNVKLKPLIAGLQPKMV